MEILTIFRPSLTFYKSLDDSVANRMLYLNKTACLDEKRSVSAVIEMLSKNYLIPVAKITCEKIQAIHFCQNEPEPWHQKSSVKRLSTEGMMFSSAVGDIFSDEHARLYIHRFDGFEDITLQLPEWLRKRLKQI